MSDSDSEGSIPLHETKKRRIGDIEPLHLSSEEPESITRDSKLWFDDGNIILQAENTQFRVHRGPISVHSSIFQDMFMIPQPKEGGETVEGCAVVHVPDRAADWENLLMAMYNLFETSPFQKDYSPRRVISLLRLGHKYDFDLFRGIGAECIKRALPTTLDKWNQCPDHLPDARHPSEGEPYAEGHEIFDLINVALEVGLRSILPVIYFICLRDATSDEILDGMERRDGTISKLPSHVQNTLIRSLPELSRQAIKYTVLDPFQELETSRASGKVKCLSPTPSPQAFNSRSKFADERILLFASQPGAALQNAENLADCCSTCNSFLRFREQQGRLKIWQGLPTLFGLPSWEDETDFDE